MKILYIEDDKRVQSTLHRFFRIYFEGSLVVTTEDYADSVAMLAEANHVSSPYDVVVSDFNLRRGNGADVLQWCYEHRPQLVSRFIFLTGQEQKHAANEMKTEHMRVKVLGHPHWLVKPINMPTLEALINKVTGRVS